ncbi:MAG: hypothetical protein GY847_28900 [Proteobacteria bacterium]|nr:hypothetical protein [Pseudomonadota bacterium]
MLVKSSDLLACRTDDELDLLIDNILSEATQGNDPPFLSDLIIGAAVGAQPLMSALGDREVQEMNLPDSERFRWKIQVLCDEWGNKPQPGEDVTRKVQKSLYKKPGKPYTGIEINRSKMDGSYERKFENNYKYLIDEKGCITCGFTAAVSLLNLYGVHAKTGYGMPHGKPQNTESLDRQANQEIGRLGRSPDGQMRHVWYWRYKEIDLADYEALPFLEKSSKPKRGHKQ